MWFSIDKNIDMNETFMLFIKEFIMLCPTSIGKKIKINNSKGEKKYKTIYSPVSVRKTSFRERKIESNHLKIINKQIKSLFFDGKTYIKTKNDIENERKSLIHNCNFDDKDFNFFIFMERPDMSDTESVYYYIRNSFAHGSFKIKNGVYFLESKKDDIIKAEARIKESTLRDLIKFKNQKIKDIKNYNKSNCKNNK